MLPLPEDRDKAERVLRAVETLADCFGDLMIQGRGFLAFSRHASFRSDPGFVEASSNILKVEDSDRTWSLHTLSWAAESTLKVAGGVVWLGPAGRSLEFLVRVQPASVVDRPVRIFLDPQGPDAGTGAAISRLENLGDAQVVQSFATDRVLSAAPMRIALVVLAAPESPTELALLEALLPRLESGAVLLFEEFGMMRFLDRHIAIVKMLRAWGAAPLEINTGQGLAVWR